MIGERIAQARQARGWSLQHLADSAGNVITKQAISKYEQGKDMPGSAALLALSRALNLPLDWFFRPDNLQATLGEAACRKRSHLPKYKLDAILAQARDQVSRQLELESIVGAEVGEGFVRPAPVSGSGAEMGEQLARGVREAWRLGDDAIQDLTGLLEDHGVVVVSLDGADAKFDGLAAWADWGGASVPVVVTKSGVSGDRQRSTLAHELGHLVMPDDAADEDAEEAALRFSGALLVPASTARRELGSRRGYLECQELIMLKSEYGMSMQQWVRRARDLEIISERCYSEWFTEASVKGWRMQEPGEPYPSESPKRCRRLAFRALAEDLASPPRIAELSGIPLAELTAGRCA